MTRKLIKIFNMGLMVTESSKVQNHHGMTCGSSHDAGTVSENLHMILSLRQRAGGETDTDRE